MISRIIRDCQLLYWILDYCCRRSFRLGDSPEVGCHDMVTSINLFTSKSRLNEFEELLILLSSVVHSPQRPSQSASLVNQKEVTVQYWFGFHVMSLKVAPIIKARMMEYGTTMVSYQPLGDKVNFFRMVISNPAAAHQDIDFLIEEIERLGQDL